MSKYGKVVRFHENGRTYSWYPATRYVYNASGQVVAKDCYNLVQARRGVK